MTPHETGSTVTPGAPRAAPPPLCANIVETPSYPLISEQGGKDDSLCW